MDHTDVHVCGQFPGGGSRSARHGGGRFYEIPVYAAAVNSLHAAAAPVCGARSVSVFSECGEGQPGGETAVYGLRKSLFKGKTFDVK